MTNEQWRAFESFRARFSERCEAWTDEAGGSNGWLATLLRDAAVADSNPDYPLENPIVYNRALDGIVAEDTLAIIVVGDNPGKDEQLERNRRYLVGQAGKLGEGFFRKNPELNVDFRRNVVILNKTPIHTAKTKQLAHVLRHGGERFRTLFEETQRWMAKETLALRAALDCDLWLVGYGELKDKGVFTAYARELTGGRTAGDAIRLYQHFSMNRFSIDLRERYRQDETLSENLRRVGVFHRQEVLGW